MHHKHKLSVAALGFAFGITAAIGLLALGWIGWWSGWGMEMTSIISSVYLGFKPTFWGGIIGAAWAFVDFFIMGIILGAIYNCCSCKKHCVERNEGIGGGL